MRPTCEGIPQDQCQGRGIDRWWWCRPQPKAKGKRISADTHPNNRHGSTRASLWSRSCPAWCFLQARFPSLLSLVERIPLQRERPLVPRSLTHVASFDEILLYRDQLFMDCFIRPPACDDDPTVMSLLSIFSTCVCERYSMLPRDHAVGVVLYVVYDVAYDLLSWTSIRR